MHRKTASLFDHLASAGEQHRWHNDAKRFRGLQIDHQLELGRLPVRKVVRPSPQCSPLPSRTGDPRFTLASSLALRKHWPASQALRLLAITNPMPPRITSEDAVRRTVIPSPSTNAPPSAVITGTLNCTDAPCVGVRPGIAAYQIV
jgi:hypothetical protein